MPLASVNLFYSCINVWEDEVHFQGGSDLEEDGVQDKTGAPSPRNVNSSLCLQPKPQLHSLLTAEWLNIRGPQKRA